MNTFTYSCPVKVYFGVKQQRKIWLPSLPSNHGQGLAVIHPVLYRHMLPEATAQFARLAVEVWNVNPEGKSREELANL